MESKNKPAIGWIGLGVMGSSMAKNLINAGFSLTVYSRTKSKAEPVLALGANWVDSPKLVAESSDIVFSIVGFPNDVESVMLGENGALLGLKKGGILCDMTTSCPKLAAKIHEKARAAGCMSLDAPVTGGDIGARNATLSIFAGGDKEAYEKVLPCFEAMGKKFMYCGAAGSGQKAKLANQIAVANVTFSVCESMLFAYEAGLNVPEWLELVVRGAGGSVAMDTLGRRLLKADFTPGFFIDHFVKDLRLCLDECRSLGLVLPGLTLADQFWRICQARGNGKNGTQFLIECLADLSGKKWQPQ